MTLSSYTPIGEPPAPHGEGSDWCQVLQAPEGHRVQSHGDDHCDLILLQAPAEYDQLHVPGAADGSGVPGALGEPPLHHRG